MNIPAVNGLLEVDLWFLAMVVVEILEICTDNTVQNGCIDYEKSLR
jgi:hypothetical protein